MILRYLFFPLLACSGSLQAQPSDTLPPPRRHFEVGLNITNTIGSFVGSANTLTSDPYLLTLRIGGSTRRVRTGLNFRIRDKSDPNFIGTLTQKETVFQGRAGYEWVVPMSRRLAMYWGLDGVFEHTRNDLKTFVSTGGTATLTNRQRGGGGGPVLGIAWRVHPRVAFTTECSVYAIYRRSTEQVVAPPDFSRKIVHDFSWQPLLPTSLFINFIL